MPSEWLGGAWGAKLRRITSREISTRSSCSAMIRYMILPILHRSIHPTGTVHARDGGERHALKSAGPPQMLAMHCFLDSSYAQL
jgi:hypothetical protein